MVCEVYCRGKQEIREGVEKWGGWSGEGGENAFPSSLPTPPSPLSKMQSSPSFAEAKKGDVRAKKVLREVKSDGNNCSATG